MSEYAPISECRLCEAKSLEVVFDLGIMANASVFPASIDTPVTEGPLTLVKCMSCGLVQLQHSYGRAEIDAGHYGYRSGLNQTMVSHLQDIAKLALTIKPNAKSVMDIGANDATLLKAFPETLWRCGVEPNYEQFCEFWPDDVIAVPNYFTKPTQEAFSLAGLDIDIITTIAMLYDLEDPIEFAINIQRSLAPDGLWITEQSYLPTMLAQRAYDTVCHEHVEYYGLEQLEYIAMRSGFQIVHTEFTDTNGGSLLAVLEKGITPYDAGFIKDERTKTSVAAFRTFQAQVEASRISLNATLDCFNVVHGLGASTKGNIILQYCRPDLPCIAEINEDKFGRFTPGTHIPIVSEEESREANPDGYLVLPWHFREAFWRRYPNDTLIFPLG